MGNRILNFRTNPALRARIEHEAAAAGLCVSDFVRQSVLSVILEREARRAGAEEVRRRLLETTK